MRSSRDMWIAECYMAGSTRLELATSGVTASLVPVEHHVLCGASRVFGMNSEREKAGRGSCLSVKGCRTFRDRRFERADSLRTPVRPNLFKACSPAHRIGRLWKFKASDGGSSLVLASNLRADRRFEDPKHRESKARSASAFKRKRFREFRTAHRVLVPPA